MTYVLALDVGTSSVRAALYDERGEALPGLSAARSHSPETTPDGGVQMDAEELFQRVLGCVEAVLERAGERARSIAAVGMCTFWHSVLGVGADGRPVSPVLLWADTRSVAEAAELRWRLDERAVHARTGCLLHTSYLPARLLWVARHRPEWHRAAVRWLSPGEYFHSRLFGEPVCSVSMASGTGLYSHETGDWDAEVLAALPIRREQLAPIVDTGTLFRGLRPEFARRLPALATVPWLPAAGDGACSNLGSGCVSPDRMALMIGTSGALRVMRAADPAGAPELPPPPGLWKYRLDRRQYLLGGALSNAGNLFAWMRETLRLPAGEELETELARMEPDAHGLTVLPFLAGERSPGWRGDARAALVGLSWNTRPVEILRAGLEAVACRFALLHERLLPAASPEHRIVASGGALLAFPVWTQILADALGRELIPSEEAEASSRGAALLALEAAGLIDDPAALSPRLAAPVAPDPQRHARYREARERQQRLYRVLVERDWRSEG